jgi:hypothetical protein
MMKLDFVDHRRINYLDGFGVEQTRTSKIAETNVTSSLT